MVYFIAICEGKKYVVKDLNIHFTTEFGKVDLSVMKTAKVGDILITTKGFEVLLVKPSFYDLYGLMKRGAQSINLKDCGTILAETLVGKDSTCLDCGAGMGGLTCFLARYVKKVYSVDYKEAHLKNTQKNAEKLGLKNIKFIQHDIYNSIPKKNLDLITLDLVEPYKLVEMAKKSLKKGGFLVAYCPQATQMQEFANKVKKEKMKLIKSIEVSQKLWKIDGKILRPEHIGLLHTGYLIFARNI